MRNTQTHTYTHIYTYILKLLLRSGSLPVVRIALTQTREQLSISAIIEMAAADQSPLSMKQLYTTLRPSRFHLAFTIALQSIQAQLPFTYRSTSAIAISAKYVSLKSTIHAKMSKPSEIYLHFLFLYTYFLFLLLSKNVF